MTESELSVIVEAITEDVINDADDRLAAAEQEFRRVTGLPDDDPADLALGDLFGAYADLGRQIGARAFWAGFTRAAA